MLMPLSIGRQSQLRIVQLLTVILVLVGLLSYFSSKPMPVAESSTEQYLTLYEQLYQTDIHQQELRLVIRLPAAGIGNRLTASVSALVLGLILKRPVFIDGGDYRFAKLIAPRRIDWDADALPNLPSLAVWPDSKVAQFLCMDLQADVPVGPILLETGQYFLPHLQANPLYAHLFSRNANGPLAMPDLFGFLLKRYFAPVPHLESQISAIESNMAPYPTRIGIHLRNVYHTTENKRRQFGCIEFLAEQSVGPVAVFVASDTLKWRKAAQETFQGTNGLFFNLR